MWTVIMTTKKIQRGSVEKERSNKSRDRTGRSRVKNIGELELR